jgi:RNA-splicing ligase RtcB
LKVANYYTNAAKKQQFSGEEYARELEEMKNSVKNKRMLPQLIKELKYKHNKGISKEYLRGDLMKSYLIDMAVAQMYAKINRQTMLNNMCKILGFGIVETIESVHNYISPTDLMIRKGAISAHTNELCIIPFNMKDGLLVCKGKGNNDWNNSAPHGAGRVFSRSAAKANISMKDYRASMREVYSSSINLSTLDEAPQAYKSPKLIELLIAPTVKILHRIKPVLNIKASE